MKKFLSLVLALVMTMSLVTMAGAEDFTDAADVDYAEAVEVLEAVGIISGYTDGSFRPDVELNRGQAAKIICNLVLGPTTANALPTSVSPYKDVPAGSTFAGYIAYLAKEGLVSGYADGTFQPTAKLTGYAFMKMLLGALGYDQSIEGYTGSNWAVSVAKQALALELNDGLAGDFVGTKIVTRQEAMLYAFNALKCAEVEYKNNSTIVVGNVTIQNQSNATPVTGNAYYVDLFKGELDADPAVDVYGRPATAWTYEDEEIGTYADKADAVYTTNALQYTVKKDLSIGTTDAVKFYYTLNTGKTQVASAVLGNFNQAVTSTSTAKLADWAGLTAGNGVTVEFFYDDDDMAGAYNEVVVIDEYIGKINEVKTDDDGRYVRVLDKKFYTKDFAKGDMVLYTIGKGTSDKIVTMKAATKLTGTITKIEGTSWYVDGVKYDVHGTAAAPTSSVGDVVDFYLDSCGYIIKMDTSSLSAALENLVMVYDGKEIGWDNQAKVVYGTGKTEIVKLKDAATTYDYIYNFTTSSGKLEVSESAGYQADSDSSVAGWEKGSVAMGSIAVDNNTTFVYLNTAKDTATVYTGKNNAPSFAATVEAVGYKKSTASAALLVIVKDPGTLQNNLSSLVMLLADNDDKLTSEKNSAKETYSYYAVKDFAGNTVKVAASQLSSISDRNTYYGVALVSAMSLDKNDVATSITVETEIADEIGGYALEEAAKSMISVSGGNLYVSFDADLTDDTAGTVSATYSVADACKVYVVAKDCETVETGDLDTIVDVYGKYAGLTWISSTEDGVIDTLILKLA